MCQLPEKEAMDIWQQVIRRSDIEITLLFTHHCMHCTHQAYSAAVSQGSFVQFRDLAQYSYFFPCLEHLLLMLVKNDRLVTQIFFEHIRLHHEYVRSEVMFYMKHMHDLDMFDHTLDLFYDVSLISQLQTKHGHWVRKQIKRLQKATMCVGLLDTIHVYSLAVDAMNISVFDEDDWEDIYDDF
jgi:hypothetical protein